MDLKIIDSLFNKLNTNVLTYDKNISKIYKIHKYWSRKPWYIVSKYIEKYSKPGDIVLDPFCGSGVTGLESICLNRNFIGGDLNPMSVLITKETLNTSTDLTSLYKDQEKLIANCKASILSLYQLSQKCRCCGKNLAIKYIKSGPKFQKPVAVSYCPNCLSKKSEREITEFCVDDSEESSFWSPKVDFPKKFYKDRFSYKGIKSIKDMYSNRNWHALSVLYDCINKFISSENIDIFKLAFTNTLLHVSKLKGINIRPLGVNNYWIPDDYISENVWFRFEERLNNIIQSKVELLKRIKNHQLGNYSIFTRSATEPLEPEYFDYVFTDPPYGDAIQYSELSYIWNSWMEQSFCTEKEIIVNPAQNKTNKEFFDLLDASLSNIYNALKTGGRFTLCFQNKDFSVWEHVINTCKKLHFALDDIDFFDVYGTPFNKNWSKFSPTADIYVTFLKTDEPDIKTVESEDSLEKLVVSILSYFKDKKEPYDLVKIYDIVVGYLIWILYYGNGKKDYKFSIKNILNVINANL
jgi:DNA modification methylase